MQKIDLLIGAAYVMYEYETVEAPRFSPAGILAQGRILARSFDQ